MSMGGAETLAPPIFSGRAFANMSGAMLEEIVYDHLRVTNRDGDFS